jgi:hypothetical protein
VLRVAERLPHETTSRNRYRNSLGLPAITAILIVVASLALVGLGIVVSKNRVRALGEEQRKVESEIRLLRSNPRFSP